MFGRLTCMKKGKFISTLGTKITKQGFKGVQVFINWKQETWGWELN